MNLAHIESNLPVLSMEDGLGIVYLIESAQQFWSELEDILKIAEDGTPTLSLLDATLRRFLALCAAYHEQYLQSPLQLEHACNLLLDSELFQFHSERMCEIIVDDARATTDPHSVFLFYEVLFYFGGRRQEVFRSHKRWQPLLPLLMEHVVVEIDPDIEDTYAGTTVGRSTNFSAVPIPIEAKLRSLSVKLLYEVCRVQTLSAQDLRIFDDSFIDYQFDLVEQTRFMHDDTFNYSVIKLIISLNEQFMVAGLGEDGVNPPTDKFDPSEPTNRVLRVMMRRLGSCKTFGENMIFMLNRAKRTPDDFCMTLLILKILYLLFSTKGTSEYFYTNDLCVLVDVFLRELSDLDEDSKSLRHTYLRVFHPLLTKTQLREIPYKRPQILLTLESLISHHKIREVNPTTKRLVDRCLSGDWCVQLMKLRKDTDRVGSPNSDLSAILSPPGTLGPNASTHLEPGNMVMKSIKYSKSVENLAGTRLDQPRQPLRSPLDQMRRPSNASIISLPGFVGPPTPRGIAAPSPKRRTTSFAPDTHGSRHNSGPPDDDFRNQIPDNSSVPPLPPLPKNIPPPPRSPIKLEFAATHPTAVSAQSQPSSRHRRPPPPAPPKRRKPPAIPLGQSNNNITMTTILSSEPSPLSKVYKSPIGVQGTAS